MTRATRDRIWDAVPLHPAQHADERLGSAPTGEDHPLDLGHLDAATKAQVIARLLSRDFDAWSETASRVGHCAKPIRLHGSSQTVDTRTGEVLSSFSSTDAPLGVLHVRCGNRRAADCQSCSRVYAADTFHLIRAGVTGGKGVPEEVAENPLVFATLTAPSFGLVHGTRGGRPCRPFTIKGQDRVCEHGRPTVCHTRHGDGDEQVGQPLCRDCYDYESHLVWQWWAPELWRRFTIDLRRALAKHLGVPESRLGQLVTVQYAKVAEYQQRGIVHFHALIRLDGPKTVGGFAPAPAGLSAALLARLVEQAAAGVVFDAPPLHEGDVTRRLRFGAQLDARPATTARRTDDPDRALAPEQVAGYLAKYATKSATDSVNTDSPHARRLRATIAAVTDRIHTDARVEDNPVGDHPYGLLFKWRHMLGFRGHFSTKSRRYSVTLGQLRRRRVRYQRALAAAHREGRTIDVRDLDDLLQDDTEETTLVIGHWTYAGTGWDTDGDTELAKAAAARAREYAQERAAQRMNFGSRKTI
ncbi:MULTISPECIES: replication initiator [Intrasporangiaceae]|uniref:Replication initiation protein n=1 Tax=Intrasporangium chromatireducens Q5-1 TaxID=584657 RepID=W9GQB9_9MICO|nr:replication initiator [Intrasporangium chromatireducens]EWT06049.1 replication initiation protein [Intrasporangium chromatireducens Q5-1]